MRCAGSLLFFACAMASAAEIRLIGILGSKALVEFDGSSPRLVAVGQMAGQARLLAVNSDGAQFDVGGRKVWYSLDNRSIPRNPGADASQLILQMGDDGHFLAHMRINKLPLLGVIDTGASTLALSSIHARMAGIDPDQGEVRRAQTAQGWVDIRRIRVQRLQLGGFTLYDVDAVVIDGEFPLKPLIGMNVLQRFSMQREAEVLVLSPRY